MDIDKQAMPNTVDPASAPDDEFRRLMERVRAGCPDAAQRGMQPLRRAHPQDRPSPPAPRMRRQYDSIDFLQDVWASFFVAALDKYDL